MKNNIELKPCPFCGSNGVKLLASTRRGYITAVVCLDCHMEFGHPYASNATRKVLREMGGNFPHLKTNKEVEQILADVWNRRAE